MNSGLGRILVVLLAIASACATALIVLNILRNPTPIRNGQTPDETVRSGRIGPTLFDQPVALPDFALTERSGRTVGLEQLRGKVWIAGFIFTRCAGPCPMITARMARLQDRLRSHGRWDDLRLVTFTVDPERDTPERLRVYADATGADPEHWLFLTGERQIIWDFIIRGFLQPVSDQPEDDAMPILHSQKLALVDQQGRIRGFYRALDERAPDGTVAGSEMDGLVSDIDRLLESGSAR